MLIPIEYIKIAGVVLSLLLVVFTRQQHLTAWFHLGKVQVNYADLIAGYLLSTLIFSLVFLPNTSTYAIWFFYGVILAASYTFNALFAGENVNKIAIVIDLILIAELIAIVRDELFWDWQWGVIATGFAVCMVCSGLIIGCNAIRTGLK